MRIIAITSTVFLLTAVRADAQLYVKSADLNKSFDVGESNDFVFKFYVKAKSVQPQQQPARYIQVAVSDDRVYALHFNDGLDDSKAPDAEIASFLRFFSEHFADGTPTRFQWVTDKQASQLFPPIGNSETYVGEIMGPSFWVTTKLVEVGTGRVVSSRTDLRTLHTGRQYLGVTNSFDQCVVLRADDGKAYAVVSVSIKYDPNSKLAPRPQMNCVMLTPSAFWDMVYQKTISNESPSNEALYVLSKAGHVGVGAHSGAVFKLPNMVEVNQGRRGVTIGMAAERGELPEKFLDEACAAMLAREKQSLSDYLVKELTLLPDATLERRLRLLPAALPTKDMMKLVNVRTALRKTPERIDAVLHQIAKERRLPAPPKPGESQTEWKRWAASIPKQQ